MEANTLISVIVPVYNVEKLLPKCLDSILAQTHENLEIILVDDGTKDRGGIICESYAKCDNSGCTGRLYLSSQSIEFYADDYKALKDNFLIDIDDVRNVDAIAPNKIQVYAKKEVYTFTVPDGTAGEWAHEIVRA